MKSLSAAAASALLLSLSASTLSAADFPAFSESFSALSGDQTGKKIDNFGYGSGGLKADFTWMSGQKSSLEPSSEVLRLTMDPAEKPGAWQGPNLTSSGFCKYGTYAARLKIPSVTSQPNVGGVVGFYTYYNDQWNTELPADINKNKLYDNSEIDFEWLIADPQIIYLTAWTDHQETETSNACRKVSRIVNLAKGIIYETVYSEIVGGDGTPLSGAENSPAKITAIPGFDASKQFYTYGFDWKEDQIRWWIIDPATEDTVVLWDYRGPKERITQKEASLMLNIWHTSDWPVQTNSKSTEAPKDTFSVEFDWVRYTPAGNSVPVQNSPQKRALRIEQNGAVSGISLDRAVQGELKIYSFSGELLAKTAVFGSEASFPTPKTPVVVLLKEIGGAESYTRFTPR